MTTNPDLQRILDLPTTNPDPGAAGRWTELLRKTGSTAALKAIQGQALAEFDLNLKAWAEGDRPTIEDQVWGPRGFLGPIGVGHGKTGISFLLPEVQRRRMGTTRPLLIVPPDLVHKTEVDYAWWARHFRFPRPHILSMGKLSHASHTDFLERYKPTIIVIDEAHKFAGVDSSRTKRLIRYVTTHRECVVAAMSGTLTQKSLADYRHLAELTLRDNCPIPGDVHDLELWQSMIDVGGQPDYKARKAVLPLVNWHLRRQGKSDVATRGVTKELARDAFSDRLRACPGVVATSDTSCQASLVIRKWQVDLPESWKKACDEFSDTGMWEMPDGTEVVDSFAAARAKSQLSSGYYSRWVWPRRCSLCHTPAEWDYHEDCPEGCKGPGWTEWAYGPDDEWLDKRRAWASTERALLKHVGTKMGSDSPALIQKLTRKGAFGESRLATLEAWEGVRPRYFTPGLGYQPPVEYVDLEPGPEWLADRVKEWCAVYKRGLIWYSTPHVGEALRRAGFRVYGAQTNQPHKTVDTPCVKIDVHGTGKNMQAWDRCLVLEFSGNAKTWEQMLGRNHRPGQDSDEVHVDVLCAGSHRLEMFMAAKVGSEYIERTLAMKQKLRIATYGDTFTSPRRSV